MSAMLRNALVGFFNQLRLESELKANTAWLCCSRKLRWVAGQVATIGFLGARATPKRAKSAWAASLINKPESVKTAFIRASFCFVIAT